MFAASSHDLIRSDVSGRGKRRTERAQRNEAWEKRRSTGGAGESPSQRLQRLSHYRAS
jgi:hypothetical protein